DRMRKRHMRIVYDPSHETHERIGLASLYAWQIRASVDLMNHHFEVDGVATAWVDPLGRVTGDAQLHFAARVAMGVQRCVAAVAGFGLHDLSSLGDRRAVRSEVERGVGGPTNAVDGSGGVERNRVRLGAVVVLGEDGLEAVLVFPFFVE